MSGYTAEELVGMAKGRDGAPEGVDGSVWLQAAQEVLADDDYEGASSRILAKAVVERVRNLELTRAKEEADAAAAAERARADAAEQRHQEERARAEEERVRANRAEFTSTASSLAATDDPSDDRDCLLSLCHGAAFPPRPADEEADYVRESDVNTSLLFGSSLDSSTRQSRSPGLPPTRKIRMSAFRRQFVLGTPSEFTVRLWEGLEPEFVLAELGRVFWSDDSRLLEAFVDTEVVALSTLRSAWAYVSVNQDRHLREPREFQPMFTLWLAGFVASLSPYLSESFGPLEVRAANATELALPITASDGSSKTLVGKSDIFVVRAFAWAAASEEPDPEVRAAAQLDAVVTHVELKSPFAHLYQAPAYQQKEQLLAETEAIGRLRNSTAPAVGLLTDGFVINVGLRNPDDGVHHLATRTVEARAYVSRVLLALAVGLGLVGSAAAVGLGRDEPLETSTVIEPWDELEESEPGGDGQSPDKGSNDDDDAGPSDGGRGGNNENVPGTTAYDIRQLLIWDAKRRGSVYTTPSALRALDNNMASSAL